MLGSKSKPRMNPLGLLQWGNLPAASCGRRSFLGRSCSGGLLLLCLVAVGYAEQQGDDLMQTLRGSYRGWADCCRLSNPMVQVVVTPAAGARVIVFAYQGQNVLFVDEQANGLTLADEANWMPWDGAAPDTIAPGGGGSELAHIWLGGYRVLEHSPLYLKCCSRDNQAAGLRMEKEFILDPQRPLLTLRRTITNLRQAPARWSFWERTLVPGGSSLAVAPLNPGSHYQPSGWAWHKDGQYQPGPATQINPQVQAGMLLLRPEGSGSGIGLDASQGWTAAIVKGIFFGITFPLWSEREYPWGQRINNIFYFANNRIELEPLSPYFEIAPQGTAQWSVVWHLSPFGELPAESADLVSRIKEKVAQLP